MKKIVSLLLCMGMLLVSCDVLPSSDAPGVPYSADASAFYPITSPFTDAKTRILYVNAGVISYYNKLTQEIFPFCFDTLCSHDDYNCISYQFSMAELGAQSVRYCAFDNRFYALRGEQLYSFAFDGSDVELEHSFGEEGDLAADRMAYLDGGLIYLQIFGKNIYFLARSSESGKRALMCYDAEREKLRTVFYDGGTTVYGYLLCGDALYLSLVGNYAGLYRMASDGTGLTQISAEIHTSIGDGIFDGERLYFVRTTPQYDIEKQYTRYLPEMLVAYCPETNTFEDVMRLEGQKKHRLLAVTEDFLYYTVQEPIVIGSYVHEIYDVKEEYNEYSRIYRLDKENGEIVTVLDDLRCETNTLYFCEDTVFLTGHVCMISDTQAWRTKGGFTARMDENGTFIDLTPIRGEAQSADEINGEVGKE